jgi:CHAT domain-containing protein
MGDTDEAVRYLESALPLARQIGFRNAEANVLYQLGVGTYLSGEPERSREYLQQALDIQSAVQDVRGQALTLRQLAAVQLALGLPREALPSITDAMKKSPAGDAVAYSGALTLANVHAALGDAPTAGATYQQALDRFRKIRARDRESAALVMFGDFQARQGRYAEARALLQQGLAVYESLRSRIVDPDLRMSYTARSLPFYQRYIDVLMSLERDSPGAGFAEEAFSTSERARARGLLEMLATSGVDIRRGVDPALVEKERTLRWDLNAKAAVQTSLLSGKRDDARLQLLEKQMTELSAALRETTTRIRQESPTYAELVEPQPLTPAEVGRLLDDDTVLLEYALGETRSWLYAVTPTSFDSFPLPSRRAIDDAARDLYRLLTSRQPVSGESAAQRQARVRRSDAELKDRRRALANLVLGPVGARLAGQWRGRRLAIVPAGALEYVPFGALPLPGAPGNAVGDTPLVRAHELVTLPSASVLALLRQPRGRRAAMSGVVAVVADPVFSADDPRVGKRATPVKRPATVPAPAPETPVEGQPGRSVTTRALEPFAGAGVRAALARLPFTRTEARAVVSLAPPASVLHATDFDASLSLITSGRLEGYRMVHFATHGLINSTRPELSGLALSLVDNRGRPQDGFLRLNTIYNLWLPADLVVLSACQSALGKEIAGEGLVGLTRGFMYAGAPRVVASLWQVSDLATAELMKRFYAGMLQRRLPASAALRAAQLEMARDPRWAPPYFWAGFVLQGDWR